MKTGFQWLDFLRKVGSNGWKKGKTAFQWLEGVGAGGPPALPEEKRVFGPRGAFVHPPIIISALCAALFSCSCAEPCLATHVTVYVQPYSVDLTMQGAFALGEEVGVRVTGLDAETASGAEGLVLALYRGTNAVAVGTNFTAEAAGSNGVSRSASGSVDCRTAELAAEFEGAGPLAERDLYAFLYSRGGSNFVASGRAACRNSPLDPETLGNFVPVGQDLWASAVFEAMREWVEAYVAGAVAEGQRSQWVVNAGGWHYPDYFFASARAGGEPSESVAISTNTTVNAVETLHETTSVRGWLLEEEVVRQAQFGSGVAWEAVSARRGGRDRVWSPVVEMSIDPANLVVEGGEVRFAEGYEPTVGDFAAVRGRMGEFERVLELDVTGENVSTEGQWQFDGWATDGLIYMLDWYSRNLADFYSNRATHVRAWTNGYGNETTHVTAGWTNSWVQAANHMLSSVSYHTDGRERKPGEPAMWGVYMPLTLVTPRHAICANHWKPMVGSNVYWVGASGDIYTNRVTAYKNIRGDLTVARLETAMEIPAYHNSEHPDWEYDVIRDIMLPYLLPDDYEPWFYGCEHGGVGCKGVPVVSLDCAERAYVTYWQCAPALTGKRARDKREFTVKARGTGTAHGRAKAAVGGDSGSPTFLLMCDEVVDSEEEYALERPVLLGCFHWATSGGTAGGPIPFAGEVNQAIAEWGDEERAEEADFGAWGYEMYDPGMNPW